MTQTPHKASSEQTGLHILVGNDEYIAFVTEIKLDNTVYYRAMVPNDMPAPRGKAQPPAWHYTHDTLQDAKDWCIAELVNRRLT